MTRRMMLDVPSEVHTVLAAMAATATVRPGIVTPSEIAVRILSRGVRQYASAAASAAVAMVGGRV